MLRISYDDLVAVLRGALERSGMAPVRAGRCARLFADASLDGVASHGVNRFPRFMHMIGTGHIDVHARPERIAAYGALERWDGCGGPGNLNAQECMAAAIALSRAHGIGCIALRNTNHWMRGGAYGWQAADAGAMAVCWTNTLPNMPPWGATDPRIGNNPIVIAVPRPPAHVVLDTAMSQFSFGALESYRKRGERLPVAGGYDALGALTGDPGAIEASGRVLPIGYWKGSGLSLLLDLVAALLSAGNASWQIPRDSNAESGLSQVFIALDVAAAGGPDVTARVVEDVLQHTQGAAGAAQTVRYPGERAIEARRRNLLEGIPVDEDVWRVVRSL